MFRVKRRQQADNTPTGLAAAKAKVSDANVKRDARPEPKPATVGRFRATPVRRGRYRTSVVQADIGRLDDSGPTLQVRLHIISQLSR